MVFMLLFLLINKELKAPYNIRKKFMFNLRLEVHSISTISYTPTLQSIYAMLTGLGFPLKYFLTTEICIQYGVVKGFSKIFND